MGNTEEDKVCEVDECELDARSNSAQYCEKHYMRMRRNGTLNVTFTEPTGTCRQCGTETQKVYCSRRCQTRFYRSRQEIETACKMCDAVIPSSTRSDARFCSKVCGMRWRYNNDPEVRERIISYGYRRNKGLVGSHTADEWKELLVKYDFMCLCCGSKESITRDHVIPIKMGGTDDIENIQPLCRSCNSKKQVKTIDYRPIDAEGFNVLH